jgi:Tfp pilus assembly protein PilO
MEIQNQSSDTNQKPEKAPSRFFTDYYGAMMLLVIGGFVATAFFLIRPLILQIKETNANTDAQLQRLAHERQYLSSLEQSVSAAQSIDEVSLQNVSRALPDQTNTPSLLMQLSAAAVRNGVQIQNVTFGDVRLPTTQPGVKSASSTTNIAVPFDISLSLHAASYFSLKRFLADIESSMRLMDVTGITLGAPDQYGGMSYQLQVRTYLFRGASSTSLTTP